jgi:signal transduction histidine kinase
VESLGADLQRLACALHPATLDCLGLAVALRDCCAEFSRRHGIPVKYTHRGISSHFPGPTTSTLYRVAEEALANVARHAHATQAWVAPTRTPNGIRLVIRDNGRGLDRKAVPPQPGLGFVAMRERMRSVEGSLSVHPRSGGGTEVVALAPVGKYEQPRPVCGDCATRDRAG